MQAAVTAHFACLNV